MTKILIILLAWVAISVPLGLLAGRFIAAGKGVNDDD